MLVPRFRAVAKLLDLKGENCLVKNYDSRWSTSTIRRSSESNFLHNSFDIAMEEYESFQLNPTNNIFENIFSIEKNAVRSVSMAKFTSQLRRSRKLFLIFLQRKQRSKYINNCRPSLILYECFINMSLHFKVQTLTVTPPFDTISDGQKMRIAIISQLQISSL